MSWGTDDVLGSHIRTYKFKRVEERSFFIAGGGGGAKVSEVGGRFRLRH